MFNRAHFSVRLNVCCWVPANILRHNNFVLIPVRLSVNERVIGWCVIDFFIKTEPKKVKKQPTQSLQQQPFLISSLKFYWTVRTQAINGIYCSNKQPFAAANKLREWLHDSVAWFAAGEAGFTMLNIPTLRLYEWGGYADSLTFDQNHRLLNA